MIIDNIKVKNFKSLKDIDIKLNNFTLISGVNSSGKSSLIQSLLLFKQNLESILFEEQFRNYLGANKTIKLPIKTVSFNGDYISVGNEKLILSQESSRDDMTFTLGSIEKNISIDINPKLEIMHSQNSNFEILQVFSDQTFDYLSTDRTQPKHTFDYSSKDIENNSLGIHGQYTAHYLAEKMRQPLNIEALQHPNSKTSQLLENTYKWLSEISSNVSISASADASTQSVKLTYMYEYDGGTSSNYSSLNVGFGLTYVLPVIVLILKSKPGDLIIIENPESHLHPAGQSKIAELCAVAANNDVQIIVETHSDHFLNGLRVATKKKIITPEKSQLHYFEKPENSLETIVHSLNIDEEGRIDDWPEGFFDEWDNKLNELLW